ncbi:MAG: hypothetical protein HOQ07_04015, partial [Sinomonas sp.]|nr:hypothetical protein [Sinomonas sp.]
MSAVRETGSAPYTVAAADTPGLHEIVASLPLSLAPAGTDPEQLASIAGTSGWAA